MKLNEFFTYGADGFEQDKTYEPEHDISILDSEDTRKTRLTLKQINSMRLASEAHDAQQKEEAVFVHTFFGQILLRPVDVRRVLLMLISFC